MCYFRRADIAEATPPVWAGFQGELAALADAPGVEGLHFLHADLCPRHCRCSWDWAATGMLGLNMWFLCCCRWCVSYPPSFDGAFLAVLGYLRVSNGRIDWARRWLQRFMSCLFHPCKAELPGLQVIMNFRDGSGGSKPPYPVEPCRTKTGFNRSELRRITWYARYVAMLLAAMIVVLAPMIVVGQWPVVPTRLYCGIHCSLWQVHPGPFPQQWSCCCMPSSVCKDDPLQLLRFIFFRLKDAYVMGRSMSFSPLSRNTKDSPAWWGHQCPPSSSRTATCTPISLIVTWCANRAAGRGRAQETGVSGKCKCVCKCLYLYMITTPLRLLFRGDPYQSVRYIFRDPPLNVKLATERPPGVVFVGRVFKIPSKCKLTFSRPPSKTPWKM